MNAHSRLFSDLTNFKDVYAKPAARRKRSRNFLFLLFFFLSLTKLLCQSLSFSLSSSPFLMRSSLFPLKCTLSFLSHNAMVDVIEIHIPFPFILPRWSLRVYQDYRKIFEKRRTKNLSCLQRFSFNSLDIFILLKILSKFFHVWKYYICYSKFLNFIHLSFKRFI